MISTCTQIRFNSQEQVKQVPKFDKKDDVSLIQDPPPSLTFLSPLTYLQSQQPWKPKQYEVAKTVYLEYGDEVLTGIDILKLIQELIAKKNQGWIGRWLGITPKVEETEIYDLFPFSEDQTKVKKAVHELLDANLLKRNFHYYAIDLTPDGEEALMKAELEGR